MRGKSLATRVRETMRDVADTGWCAIGWHEMPKSELHACKGGRLVCTNCRDRRRPPTPLPIDDTKPHRVPRVAPDTPLPFFRRKK